MLQLFSSCQPKKNPESDKKAQSSPNTKHIAESNPVPEDSILLRCREFIHFLRDTNSRYILYSVKDKNLPHYIKLFDKTGLEKVHSYSLKNYPKKNPPSEYEHYDLLILEFKDSIHSQTAFGKLMYTMEFRNGKTDIPAEEIEIMRFYAKYGGLIVQKNQYILSLVERCGGPGGTLFKTWEEYEDYFLKSIFGSDLKDLLVLNANCGGDYFELIVYFDDAK